jgi:hypothetical protein
MTVFAGHQKPWAGQMGLIKAMACRSRVSTVKSVTREDLLAQGWAGSANGARTPPALLGRTGNATAIAEASASQARAEPPSSYADRKPRKRRA